MTEAQEPANGSLEKLVETLLFVSSEPLSPIALAKVLGVRIEAVEQALQSLNDCFADRGVRLQVAAGKWEMVSAPEAAAYVERLLGLPATSRLSMPALETLAIIAYHQPVTRLQVETARGVDCAGVLNTLQARGLIEDRGRLDTVGHPILYGTTSEFLRHFGLSSLGDLPPQETGLRELPSEELPSEE